MKLFFFKIAFKTGAFVGNFCFGKNSSGNNNALVFMISMRFENLLKLNFGVDPNIGGNGYHSK